MELIVKLSKLSIKSIKTEIETSIHLALNKEPIYSFEHGYHQWRLPNGKLHRLVEPAAIFQNIPSYQWFVNGKRHREDGPAIIDKQVDRYYLNDCPLSFDEYWNKQKYTKHAVEIMAYVLGDKWGK